MPKGKEETANKKSDNIKIYKILSYIGFLWIIGLFVPEKNDKKLRFHVGQGIILTIFEFCASFVVSIVNNLIVANIFRHEIMYFGYPTGVYNVSGVGVAIQTILNLALVAVTIAYAVIGIMNVVNNKEKELPIIGKLAFYK